MAVQTPSHHCWRLGGRGAFVAS